MTAPPLSSMDGAGSNTTGAPASYVIDAGFSPGTTAVSLPAGTGTSFTVPNVRRARSTCGSARSTPPGSSPPWTKSRWACPPWAWRCPKRPRPVQAFMLDGLLTMTWLQPPRGGPATGYIVEAGSASGLTNIGTVSVPGRSLTFANVPGFYFLRVRATNAGGASAPSAEVMIAVGGVPAPPSAPNFTSHTVSVSTVTLTWAAPLSGTPTSYSSKPLGPRPLESRRGEHRQHGDDDQLCGRAERTYYVRLRALNAQGASVVSNERTNRRCHSLCEARHGCPSGPASSSRSSHPPDRAPTAAATDPGGSPLRRSDPMPCFDSTRDCPPYGCRGWPVWRRLPYDVSKDGSGSS